MTGDIAIGYALASICIWIIQVAALGLFLSFMLWLLTIVLSLAFSQYALHPATAALLCDRKLDRGFALRTRAARTGLVAVRQVWAWVQQHNELRAPSVPA